MNEYINKYYSDHHIIKNKGILTSLDILLHLYYDRVTGKHLYVKIL